MKKTKCKTCNKIRKLAAKIKKGLTPDKAKRR